MSAKVVCAWCHSTLVFSSDPVTSVSHGICKPCKAKVEREIASMQSPLADTEVDSFIDKPTCEEFYFNHSLYGDRYDETRIGRAY